MKIDHRNILTPTEVTKGGFTKVKTAIQKNADEIFVIKSARADEEIAMMSVERAEHLLELEQMIDAAIDIQVFSEFKEREKAGFKAVDFGADPSIELTEEERYVPLKKRQKEGAL